MVFEPYLVLKRRNFEKNTHHLRTRPVSIWMKLDFFDCDAQFATSTLSLAFSFVCLGLIRNDECRLTIDELLMSLSEAQALQPLRARFQPVSFIGLQAGFRLVEPKSLQLGERGGFAHSFLNRQNTFIRRSMLDVRCSTFTSFFSDQTGRSRPAAPLV